MTAHANAESRTPVAQWEQTIRGRASLLCLAAHSDAPGTAWPCDEHLFEARRVLVKEGRV